MANANVLRALVAGALLALAAPATAQTAGQVIGDIRVRGAGVVQVQDQWLHLLDATTFERDEKIGRAHV